MSDQKSVMAQENFSSNTTQADGAAGDFSSDTGALAWADGQLDKLVAAMRYKLEDWGWSSGTIEAAFGPSGPDWRGR